ncbi:MAG: DNA repair protein RecN [Deltaproteobacteria bacterium]|nr:DNA repair protein RecN [Deltaproteobacteria bacterium]MBW2361503.1 DNA repair protein RecN [Deltaproteobacteria bacterium]
MIELLRIENLAIVEAAELEFGPGLNVLTGETGAGKSIVLGALALLAGGRGSADAIREGSDVADIEAVFRTDGLAELEAELMGRGLEGEEHELIVQRSLARSGRGRARVSGQLLPLTALAELLDGGIEVSSQHDSQALRRSEEHGWLLDRMGTLLDLRARVGEAYARVRGLDEELAELRAAAQERERTLDFLGFQVREIDAVELDVEEAQGLVVERSRLAHAGRLREEGGLALADLSGDPLAGDAAGAADRLADAAKRVERLVSVDPGLEASAERIAALASEVRDVATELERHLDGVDDDPARLASLDERLHQIEVLQRKYGGSVEEVLRFRDEAAQQLASLEGADEREAQLVTERGRAVAELVERAAELSKGRARVARKLAKRVQDELRELAMPQARFEVGLEPAAPAGDLPCGPNGAETAEFLFSANAGEPLRPLRKVASGGELSRVLLAIRGALRGDARGMVLVFDEVDAGIGGRAADRVGRALARLAAHHQVLCITHLPQIAAFANVHFRVEKQLRRGRTRATIHRVEGDARVDEIARMAGGEKVGEATRKHARALIAERAPTIS